MEAKNAEKPDQICGVMALKTKIYLKNNGLILLAYLLHYNVVALFERSCLF